MHPFFTPWKHRKTFWLQIICFGFLKHIKELDARLATGKSFCD